MELAEETFEGFDEVTEAGAVHQVTSGRLIIQTRRIQFKEKVKKSSEQFASVFASRLNV